MTDVSDVSEAGLATPPTTPSARWMQRLADETTTSPPEQGSAQATEAVPRYLGAGILFVLGLAWLGATMWTAHASIVDHAADTAVALGTAAAALPAVIAANLLAGATAGLAAGARFAADASPVRRMVVGLIAGTGIGVVAGGLILFGYGANARVSVLAVAVAAAALLGGAACAAPRPVLAAGLVAMFAVFGIGVVFSGFQDKLTGLFGAGSSLASQASASRTFAYTQSAVSGVIAGVSGYLYLRKRGDRPWPWYLLAGCVPGLLLLLSEALTHTGGAYLLGLVRGLSAGDRAMVDFIDFDRLRNAMIIFFVGGIAAMIAVGRTLRPADESPEESPDDSSSAA